MFIGLHILSREVSFQIFCLFLKIELFAFFVTCKSSSYILDTSPLTVACIMCLFSPSIWLVISFFKCCLFKSRSFKIFMKSDSSFFFFLARAFFFFISSLGNLCLLQHHKDFLFFLIKVFTFRSIFENICKTFTAITRKHCLEKLKKI